MKILWLDINSSYSHSSLAIPALDAQLSKELRDKHIWKLVSGTLKNDKEWFIEEIMEFNPTLILSTLWLFNHNMVMEVLSRVYAINHSIRIVLGGPEFLGENSHFFKKYPFIEALFRGEGEELFPQFIAKIEDPKECYRLPGFCTTLTDGSYIDNGVVTVSSFKDLQKPESSHFFCWDKPFVQLETSRGCFNRCSFCISGGSSPIQELTIEEVASRVKEIFSRGVREIRILDRTFNANSARAIGLINLFSKYGGQIEFHTEIHPSLMNDELKRAISEAPPGTLHLEAGVQSFQPEVLKACNRYDKKEATIEGIKFLSQLNGHQLHTDLIAGLPYYTYQQLLEDLNLLISLKPQEVQLELLKLLPGTELRERAEHFGISYSPLPPYEVLQTPEITNKELNYVISLSIIMDSYYNNSEWREHFGSIVERNSDFLKEFALYFYTNRYRQSLSKEKKLLILWEFCCNKYKDEIESVSILWMLSGFSYNYGPGAQSIQWKFGEELFNPILNRCSKETQFRYLEYPGKRLWFAYNRKTNNSKSILFFTEIL